MSPGSRTKNPELKRTVQTVLVLLITMRIIQSVSQRQRGTLVYFSHNESKNVENLSSQMHIVFIFHKDILHYLKGLRLIQKTHGHWVSMMFKLDPTDVVLICILSTMSCKAELQTHWLADLKPSLGHSHH